MKTYNELTDTEKIQARNASLTSLLTAITEGLRFDDESNSNTLQASIDAAFMEAEQNQTPWFAHEFILEARYTPCEKGMADSDGLRAVRDELDGMALCDAEDALYSEHTENIVPGIA